MKRVLTYLGLVITAIAFQNFDYAYMLFAPNIPVDQMARAEHAREILGMRYKGSLAQKAENVQDLHISIYQTVYNSLPKNYKNAAAEVTAEIIKSADEFSFDPVFVMAVIKTESSFNPRALGSAGEIGLMQLKPDTAADVARRNHIPWHGKSTLEVPKYNIRIGVAYLSELQERFNGRAYRYVNAYNMGAAGARRLLASEIHTQAYNERVMQNYAHMYKRLLATRMTIVADNH